MMAKEYIALSITDQETLDIAFAVVTPLANTLKLYIDAKMDKAPRNDAQSSFSGFLGSSHPFHHIITMKEEPFGAPPF